MKWLQFILYLFMATAQTVISSDFVVLTKNGAIRGAKETSLFTGKTKFAFRGIPFAKPPIGELRFEKPQPVENWNHILNATKEKDTCVQHYSLEARTVKILGSEDCLYLNVHTPVFPDKKHPSRLLPVMVWIYGGGFSEGESSDDVYAPDYLLNENVIVVKIAYRLNLFGFLSTGDLKYPGNNGLRDQIMALTWVKNNIEAFGGDSEKITIFGESAGAGSVSLLTQTPLTKGLYTRAIMQSGVSTCPWAISTNTGKVLSDTSALLGIKERSPHDMVKKLKAVPYKELDAASMIAADRVYASAPLQSLAVTPVIEPNHPDAIVTKPSYEKVRTGDFNLTPMLLGFNSFEGIDMQPSIEMVRLYLLKNKLLNSTFTPVNMNIKDESLKDKVGQMIKRHYFGNASETFEDKPYLHYVGDNYIVRDVMTTSRLLSKFVSVFLYQLSHLGDLGNPERSYDFGVGHAEDLNYLFGRVTSFKTVNASDALVRRIMCRLWTNFAKYGNPTPNVRDSLLQNIKWPKLDANFQYLDIQEKLSVQKNPHENDYRFWSKLYKKYEQFA